jgi:hypothetical protein
MKSTADIIKKQRRKDPEGLPKPCCGTLNYMAECRGTKKKTETARWQGQPDEVNRIVRKYTAAG